MRHTCAASDYRSEVFKEIDRLPSRVSQLDRQRVSQINAHQLYPPSNGKFIFGPFEFGNLKGWYIDCNFRLRYFRKLRKWRKFNSDIRWRDFNFWDFNFRNYHLWNFYFYILHPVF